MTTGTTSDAGPPPEAPPTPTTAGRLVYAIGDVHGRYDLLREILARLVDDHQSRPGHEPAVMVFCGDYVDRGPQSAEVIEAVLWLKTHAAFEVRPLKGNHEQAFLEFLDRPEEARPWLRYGGAATLRSYGVPPPALSDDDAALVRARDALLQTMPASHRSFLEGLEPMIVIGDYAFTHAGIRPGTPLQDQEEDDLLWIREGFLDVDGPFEKIIVHGHTWVDARPQILEHRIGLDTGAYATGVLTAARISDQGLTIFQTGA
jgi:serine/threonine protein phosphatase 1